MKKEDFISYAEFKLTDRPGARFRYSVNPISGTAGLNISSYPGYWAHHANVEEITDTVIRVYSHLLNVKVTVVIALTDCIKC